jgi:hypothetical protein
MDEQPISVTCEAGDGGWVCTVRVGADAAATTHRVTVTETTLADLAPAAGDPRELVEASFRFLLEREPRESILREFDLPLIGRYFPEFPTEIRGRVGP